MSKIEDKPIESTRILYSGFNEDLKVFETFHLYKNDLKRDYPDIYHALLEWSDVRAVELSKFKDDELSNNAINDFITSFINDES